MPAWAQYRPPPLSESQQLLRDADDLHAEAVKHESTADHKGAVERNRKAIGLYERALAVDAHLVAAAVGLGAACIDAAEYERAVKALTPVHRDNPTEAGVTYPLAVSLFKLRHYSEALPLLDELGRADAPAHFTVHFYLGTYALAERNGETAARELSRFLQVRPSELAGEDNSIYEMLGRAHLLRRNAADARAAFERAQRGRPETLRVQLGLEGVLELEGRSRDALALLDGLAKRYPGSPEVLERSARLEIALGDLPRALAAAQEMLRAQRSPASLTLVGDVRMAQKEYREAEARYREAVALSATHQPAQLGLGAALTAQERHEEAAAALERASAARGEDNALQAALGSALRRAGKYARAVEVHAALAARVPTQPLPHLLLGADHFATGQWDEAIHDYNEALKLDANQPRARHFLALALLRRARVKLGAGTVVDDVVLDARRAYDLDPSPAASQTLGALLLAGNQNGEAERVLARGAAMPGASYHLPLLHGYARLGAGDAAGALESFEKAAKLTKDPEAEAEVYLAWSLAKIELGDLELAVNRLQGPSSSEATARVMQANLRVALLKLGFKKLQNGEAAEAQKSLGAAQAVPGSMTASVASIARLLRALLELDGTHAAQAVATLHAALAQKQTWFEPLARPLLEAWADYRARRYAEARKQLAAAAKLASAKLPFAALLTRAINDGEAAQAYAAGNLKRAEQLYKSDATRLPLDPRLTYDLACIRYRLGEVEPAVAAWRSVANAVPEAELALGIWAQERQRDSRLAVEHLQRYLAARGTREPAIREWIERLQRLHGLGPATAQGGGR